MMIKNQSGGQKKEKKVCIIIIDIIGYNRYNYNDIL